MVDAFFEPDGDAFVASPLTRGPWDERFQHGGPPSALLARAVELDLPPGVRLTRASFDILRPVPIGRLTPQVSVQRGRRVARARMSLDAGGTEVIVGTAVAQQVVDLDLPEVKDTPLPPPEQGEAVPFFSMPWEEGYHTAMVWSFVEGSWAESGPSKVWLAQRVPLVAGEEPSPVQRTLVVADSGNGVSTVDHPSRLSCVNTDLSVHLHRAPVGEWIGMDAKTVAHPTGAGLATTVLHDRHGPVGSGNQSLLIAPL